MTKAVSNREVCSIKTLLLLCEHGHLFQNFASHGVNCPLPILLGLRESESEVSAYFIYARKKQNDEQIVNVNN